MERRRHVRLPFEARIDLQYEGLDAFASGYSANISSGGVFVSLSVQPPIGTALSFNLRGEDGGSLLEGGGRVLWSRTEDDGDDRPAGIAIGFTGLADHDRLRLRTILGDHADPVPDPDPPAGDGASDPTRALLFDLGLDEDDVAGGKMLTEPWTASGLGLTLPTDLDKETDRPSVERQLERPISPSPQLQEPPADEIKPRAAVRAGLEPPPEPVKARSVLQTILAWLLFLVLTVATVAAIVMVPRIWGPPWAWFNRTPDQANATGAAASVSPAPSPSPDTMAPPDRPATQQTRSQQPRSQQPRSQQPRSQQAGSEQPARRQRPSPAPSAPATASRSARANQLTNVIIARQGAATLVTMEANGSLTAAAVRHFFMPDPPRLVFRIAGITREYHQYQLRAASPHLSGVRFGLHPEVNPPELSVVVDLTSSAVRIEELRVSNRTVTFRLTLPSRR